MIFFKMTKIVSFLSLITFSMVSCTMTSTKTKNPVFSKSTDSLQADLNRIVSCERINLDGKEISNNGRLSSVLEIDITNGQNTPTSESQMEELEKQIALLVKQALKDKDEYNSYKVLFVTTKEDADLTQRTWKGKVFKSEEL
ncbi:MAG: hypothetical protein ABI091_20215 [Ferruginibacter sp.]